MTTMLWKIILAGMIAVLTWHHFRATPMLTMSGLISTESSLDSKCYFTQDGSVDAANILSRITASLRAIYRTVLYLPLYHAVLLSTQYNTEDDIIVNELPKGYDSLGMNVKKHGLFVKLRDSTHMIESCEYDNALFIAIHELAHAMQKQHTCRHDKEFDRIFNLLLFVGKLTSVIDIERVNKHCDVLLCIDGVCN